MRSPERLEIFCQELKTIHQRSFCDWRFNQLVLNFLGWVQLNKNVDGFYYEEDKTLELLREYECIYGMRQ